jgi:hypothetical protein
VKLSAKLHTKYCADSVAVGKIIRALPPLGARHTQKFFSIGDDYGTGKAPYTLTVYYEQEGKINEDYAITPRNAVLLFALIDNLEEASYAICDTPSDDELNKAEYNQRVTWTREELSDYLAADANLTWDDFHNDWNNAVERAFDLIGTGELAVPMTLDDVRAIAENIGPDLTPADGTRELVRPLPSAEPKETTPPIYDPSFVFQSEISVKTSPDRYALAMSSTPGIILSIAGQAEGLTTLKYEATSGSFGLWEDGVITGLGNPTNRKFGDSPSAHWTPDDATQNGDAVTVSLLGESGDVLAQVNMAVSVQDNWYC